MADCNDGPSEDILVWWVVRMSTIRGLAAFFSEKLLRQLLFNSLRKRKTPVAKHLKKWIHLDSQSSAISACGVGRQSRSFTFLDTCFQPQKAERWSSQRRSFQQIYGGWALQCLRVAFSCFFYGPVLSNRSVAQKSGPQHACCTSWWTSNGKQTISRTKSFLKNQKHPKTTQKTTDLESEAAERHIFLRSLKTWPHCLITRLSERHSMTKPRA